MSTDARILVGDAVDRLGFIADESVHCVVTSPPYWGLRDYGVTGQIGLESTPEEYLEKLRIVFRQVWRVLRPDGTLWVNVGDCYATGAGSCNVAGGGIQGDRWAGRSRGAPAGNWNERENPRGRVGPVLQPNRMAISGLKPKDLVGMPWRLALALQADGWWLRSDVIWHKPNVMPGSACDRPTTSHEYLFLFAKSGSPKFWVHADGRGARRRPRADFRADPRVESGDRSRKVNNWKSYDYYYDRWSTQEPAVYGEHPRNGRPGKIVTSPTPQKTTQVGLTSVAANGNASAIDHDGFGLKPGRQMRSVWSITNKRFDGGHFATFPEELATRCILASSSSGGVCVACGAPRFPMVNFRLVKSPRHGELAKASRWRLPNGTPRRGTLKRVDRISKIVGWAASCECNAAVRPAVVLDPFLGAGTTAVAAARLGRSSIGIEISRDYAKISARRIQNEIGLLTNVQLEHPLE